VGKRALSHTVGRIKPGTSLDISTKLLQSHLLFHQLVYSEDFTIRKYSWVDSELVIKILITTCSKFKN
jgi:hypothetical protein